MPARGRTGPGSFLFFFCWAPEVGGTCKSNGGEGRREFGRIFSRLLIRFLLFYFISETGFNLVSTETSLGDDVTWPFGTKGSGSLSPFQINDIIFRLIRLATLGHIIHRPAASFGDLFEFQIYRHLAHLCVQRWFYSSP